jgi:DNA-binding CsgD family transcriptional regulator
VPALHYPALRHERDRLTERRSPAALGDPEAGITALRQALALAEETESFYEISRAYFNLSMVLGDEAGRPHESLEVIRQGIERIRELGLELTLPGNALRSDMALWLWYLGRWQEAFELASEALAWELPARKAFHQHLLLGRLHMARGRLDLAHEQAQTAAGMAEQLMDLASYSFVQAYLAELATLQGDFSTARSEVAKALQQLANSEEYRLMIQLCQIGLRAAADAAERAHDRRARPAELADIHANGEQLLADARQSLAHLGSTFSNSTAYAIGCEAEFSRLELCPDPQQWAALAAAWDTLLRPYDAAYARWRQAEAMLRTKAPMATTVLRQAHQTTVELGEVPLRHEIERLAQRVRIDLQPPSVQPTSPRTQRVSTAAGLTPREQEVLRHLVESRTNRQIARALFISEKTASVHVSNIMSKLGAANRSEAAAIAHRLRLLEPNA